jgi:ParB-like chromosome segregation protein Spo0J
VTADAPGATTSYDHIAEALWPLVVPLDALRPHPRNPRQGDVGAISQSLQAFGQQKPLVAQQRTDGPHIIIAGNHLYRAAQALGWGEVAAVIAPMDDRKAMRFLVADNRTQELGVTDTNALVDILAELAMVGALDATGYDGDDVDDLLRLVGNVPGLDELMDRHGAPDSEDFLPRIAVKFQPAEWDRWQAATDGHGDDHDRVMYLLSKA